MYPVISFTFQPADEKQDQPSIPLDHDGGRLVVRGVCEGLSSRQYAGHRALDISFSQVSGGVL